MASKLMCLLTVDDAKYKLVVYAREKQVPFTTFKPYVVNKLPHLSFIFDTDQILEVYDSDFGEYVKLGKNELIEHMSRLRVVSHSPARNSELENSNVAEAFDKLTVSSTPVKAFAVKNDVKTELKATVSDTNSDHNSLQSSASRPEKGVQTNRRRKRKRRVSKSSMSSVNSAKSERSLLGFEEHKFTSDASDRSTSSQLRFTHQQQSCVKASGINRTTPVHKNHTLNKHSLGNNGVELWKLLNSKSENRVPASRTCSQQKKLSTIVDKGRVVFQEFGKVCLYESDFAINDLSSCYAICEVVCKFNRRFCEHDNAWEADNIWEKAAAHLTKVTKVRVSADSLKDRFSQLLSQYVKIIMYLVGWDEDDCSNLWPLFPMFHYELILIPFRSDIEQIARNFNHQSKTNAKFALRSLAKNKLGDEHFSIFNVLKGKRLSPLKKRVFQNPFEEDMVLIEAVKKYQWDFKNNRKCLTVVWDKIQYDVNKRTTRCFTALECRQRFELLLNQYSSMLTFMKEFSFEQCRKLWPLFGPFHCEIDYHFINKKILQLKQEYDDCEKLENEVGCNQEMGNEVTDEAEIEIKLVASIRDHIENLMNSSISEDDFWQKVAYDLSFYETPVENSSKFRWQLMFSAIVDKYMKGESENERLDGDLQQILERIYDVTTD